MKRLIWAGVWLAAAAVAQDGPETVARGTRSFQKSVVVSGLSHPWELTWGPDHMLWVTERTASRVTRVNPSTGERKVAVTIADVVAPGGQDGLLGMALHPRLLRSSNENYVFVAYTYVDRAKGPDLRVRDPMSPYRFLYAKIVRFRYDAGAETLVEPHTIIAGLPAGNDHNGYASEDQPLGQTASQHRRPGQQPTRQLLFSRSCAAFAHCR
ncbi:MAG: PQQ-dependent sugar dehydrogenase [Acidobacteria bacterium]|nr:PQQ-dependent sugar dehydrogenase [Acidobacteriota bacterium]